MIWDLLSSFFAIEGGVACFFMWAMSNPKRQLCLPMPLFVRLSFFFLGFVGVVRGVHLIHLFNHPEISYEQADWIVTLSWLVIAYHFTACAWSTWRRRLKPSTWQKFLEIALEEIRTRT
jgi:hypothetical protein